MNYKKYMKKCFKLALKAEGKTSPNPLVGCVVLDENDVEIATGYHKAYGFPHAEADALSKLSKEQAKGSTLVVNLEPCSHHGKTPPCADLIIEMGVKRVVVGMQDPNPLVAGRGLQKCKDAGIEVIMGVLEDEAKQLNEVFIKNMVNKKCFVAFKSASTLDGKIATKTGSSKWITSEKSRKEVQKIRNRYDAILTTSSTVIADNPSMTSRIKNAKNPCRIVLDRTLKTSFNSKIYDNTNEKVYVVVDEQVNLSKLSAVPRHINVIKCSVNNNKLDLDEAFAALYREGISSILVECGSNLASTLLSECLVDKVYSFIAPKYLGDRTAKNIVEGRDINDISQCLNYNLESVKKIGDDFLLILYP